MTLEHFQKIFQAVADDLATRWTVKYHEVGYDYIEHRIKAVLGFVSPRDLKVWHLCNMYELYWLEDSTPEEIFCIARDTWERQMQKQDIVDFGGTQV